MIQTRQTKKGSKKSQVLFADNDTNFLNTRTEFLESAGYHVLKAYTLEQALRILSETYVHLIILDIRLVDDDDEKDVSGLTLAKDPTYTSIPKIILTGFPSVAAVREVLGPTLGDLPPAVDFIAKLDGPDPMIKAVDKAFALFIRINWDLEIQWDRLERLSFPHLVSVVQSDLSSDLLVQRADELEDLIRRLFYDYHQIQIGRLLWHDTGRFCVPILVRSSQGVTDLRILVCGERKLMERERTQVEKLAPTISLGTDFLDKAETLHFSANLYELRGADIGTVQTLRDLFKVGRERPLRATFTHLLGDILKAWHQHGQIMQEENDLMSLYRQWVGLTNGNISRTEVEQQVELLVQLVRTLGAIKIERGNENITFQFSHQSPIRFPDPVATVYSPLANYDAPVVCKISPGRLTADNVLVDAKQNTWLTDFAFADQAPQWWDFICLEAIIRFDLSQAPDLLAWQEFEECLLKPKQLDDGLGQGHVVPELRTSVALIEQVRRQAGSETGPDLLPYYAGLLAWVVKAMACYDPGVIYTQADRLRGAHLLLGASMIAERLGTVTNTHLQEPGGQMRLDEDKVWIEDRYITTLAGLGLKLLRCLYKKAGKTVSYRTILEDAYGEKHDVIDDNQKQRIRQEVRRLREAVEPDPNHPRYIKTVRETGYRFQENGAQESNM